MTYCEIDKHSQVVPEYSRQLYLRTAEIGLGSPMQCDILPTSIAVALNHRIFLEHYWVKSIILKKGCFANTKKINNYSNIGAILSVDHCLIFRNNSSISCDVKKLFQLILQPSPLNIKLFSKMYWVVMIKRLAHNMYWALLLYKSSGWQNISESLNKQENTFQCIIDGSYSDSHIFHWTILNS